MWRTDSQIIWIIFIIIMKKLFNIYRIICLLVLSFGLIMILFYDNIFGLIILMFGLIISMALGDESFYKDKDKDINKDDDIEN